MVTFQLPSGPKNLARMFPLVDFTKVEEYFLQLREQNDLNIIATTNKFRRGCCCSSDTVRLFYVNYLGGIDAIDLKIRIEEVDIKSSRWKKPLAYPLHKWDGGTQRFNISSTESLKAENACFDEEDQEYLKELLATPNAWLGWKGTQEQEDDYMPVVVSDGKFVTRKEAERYQYVLELSLEHANENIILRN